jgi:hypothetical protein
VRFRGGSDLARLSIFGSGLKPKSPATTKDASSRMSSHVQAVTALSAITDFTSPD